LGNAYGLFKDFLRDLKLWRFSLRMTDFGSFGLSHLAIPRAVQRGPRFVYSSHVHSEPSRMSSSFNRFNLPRLRLDPTPGTPQTLSGIEPPRHIADTLF
jgi:hypothetical protein